MAYPKHTSQWKVTGKSGFNDLKFEESVPIPELGEYEVLVQFHYASLNYRDLIISKGTYPFAMKDGVVPGSDGAGSVVKTGASVTRFNVKDKVLTLFNQGHQAGDITESAMGTGVGGIVDGTFRRYGVFDQMGLVHMPDTLNYKEASTLPCAAVTAWNALYGLESKKLVPGQTVLIQGTGGVSLFGLQFAKSAGATVIATTSSNAKAEVLKKMGADHVINYNTDSAWGETAKSLTLGKAGIDHIIEIGGPNTMSQSLKAIKPEGVITVIGFVGGTNGGPSTLEALTTICTIRGTLVGSRQMFEEMNRAIDACNMKPVIDERIFGFEELKEAYQYMWDRNHFGKVVVRIM